MALRPSIRLAVRLLAILSLFYQSNLLEILAKNIKQVISRAATSGRVAVHLLTPFMYVPNIDVISLDEQDITSMVRFLGP